MPAELLITGDGSHTVCIPELNVTYHSKHGAIQESMHVYIESGLKQIQNKKISVLEVGFGTGLNALLTYIQAEKNDLEVIYEAVELHHLDDSLTAALNYLSVLEAPQYVNAFSNMHACEWNVLQTISPSFAFKKVTGDIRDMSLTGSYNLVYYDAFDPSAQPDVWTSTIFHKIYSAMEEEGMLVTYCSKTSVRKALVEAGFQVVKIPGPKGKREIVKALKARDGF